MNQFANSIRGVEELCQIARFYWLRQFFHRHWPRKAVTLGITNNDRCTKSYFQHKKIHQTFSNWPTECKASPFKYSIYVLNIFIYVYLSKDYTMLIKKVGFLRLHFANVHICKKLSATLQKHILFYSMSWPVRCVTALILKFKNKTC